MSLLAFSDEGPIQRYKHLNKKVNQVDLNNLRFTNRAQCALDSNKPTQSFFVVLDNVSLGRTLHRLASGLEKDKETEVKQGISRFRYTVSTLISIVIEKMGKGLLPILHEDITKSGLSQYVNAVKNCQNRSVECLTVNNYISKLWERSEKYTQYGLNLGALGLEYQDYLPKNTFGKNHKYSSCHYLKKFSPLEAHLQTSKPTRETFQSVGRLLGNVDQYITECSESVKYENLKVSTFQYDIRHLNSNVWNKYGFDFYHSLKLYLSYAFRYTELSKKLAFPYGNLFSRVFLEESVFMISNGCKSFESPRCDSKSLSLGKLRMFTNKDQVETLASDFLKNVPSQPYQDLLDKPIVDVNNDILNFDQFESADKWSENFVAKSSKVRGFMKMRMINAIHSFRIIEKNLPVSNLTSLFSSFLSQSGEYKKSEMNYLCSEFIVATDKDFSLIEGDLKSLRKSAKYKKFFSQLGAKNLDQYLEYFLHLKTIIKAECDQLEKKNYWDGESVKDQSRHHSWYQELVYKRKVLQQTQTINREQLKLELPLISLKTYNESRKMSDVVCLDIANCSRLFLNGIVQMSKLFRYADSLLVLDNKIHSSHIANPYNERNACGVYDPWRKTRHTIYDFLFDLANTAMFGLLPSPVYVSGTVDSKRVVSFDQLVKEGKVKYNPKFSQAKFNPAVLADLTWTGIPCSVSISKSDQNPFQYYMFNGISVGACKEKQRSQVEYISAGNSTEDGSQRTSCVSCAINLQTVSGVLSSINPVIRPIFLLLKGVVRLVENIRDPYDIPRSWEADVNKVMMAYGKDGSLSKSCVRSLRKNKHCLDTCEVKIFESIQDQFKGVIESIQIGSRQAKVKISTCSQSLFTQSFSKRSCKRDSKIDIKFQIPGHCQSKKETL